MLTVDRTASSQKSAAAPTPLQASRAQAIGDLLVTWQLTQIAILIPTGRTVQAALAPLVSPELAKGVLLGAGAVYAVGLLMKLRGWAILHLAVSLSLLWVGWRFLAAPAEAAHLYLYGGLYLGWRLRSFYKPVTSKFLFTAGLFCLGISLIDEGLQGVHPERVFDPRDIVLNLASFGIAAWLFEPFLRRETPSN